MAQDVYFKKVVPLRYRGHTLQFRVAQELFSSYEIDIGTQRLLRTLSDRPLDACTKILDLGCGYGPIGLTMKAIAPDRAVHLVDRDALAVEYTRQNAELNQVAGVATYGSLGYADVAAADFDLILSNVPATAGEPAIASFLLDAVHHLKRGGLVAVVVITRLEATVATLLAGPHVDILLRKAWPGHTVFQYRFAAGAAAALGRRDDGPGMSIYQPRVISFSFQTLHLPLRVFAVMPQSDRPSPQTEMLLEQMVRLPDGPVERAIVFNPGQGHAPAALWQLFRPEAITLVDRDLLSLRAAQHNLLLNDCPAAQVTISHQAGLHAAGHEQADLIVGALREDDGPEVHALLIRQAAGQLAARGTVVVSASATALARLETVIRSEKQLAIRERKRRKGKGVLVLQQR